MLKIDIITSEIYKSEIGLVNSFINQRLSAPMKQQFKNL